MSTTAMPEDGSTSGLNLTSNETKFLSAVMVNLTSEIQFDTEAVATMLGLKDGTTARARWNTIKRTKLGISSEKTGGGIKKTTPKKGKKGSEVGGNGGNAEGGETPVKTPKKRGRETKVEKAAEEEMAAKANEEMAIVKEEIEEGEDMDVVVGAEGE